jgi:hypothetical protein
VRAVKNVMRGWCHVHLVLLDTSTVEIGLHRIHAQGRQRLGRRCSAPLPLRAGLRRRRRASLLTVMVSANATRISTLCGTTAAPLSSGRAFHGRQKLGGVCVTV